MQHTDALATLMSAGYDVASAHSILERAEWTGSAIARGVRVTCTLPDGPFGGKVSYRVARKTRTARRRARR